MTKAIERLEQQTANFFTCNQSHPKRFRCEVEQYGLPGNRNSIQNSSSWAFLICRDAEQVESLYLDDLGEYSEEHTPESRPEQLFSIFARSTVCAFEFRSPVDSIHA